MRSIKISMFLYDEDRREMLLNIRLYPCKWPQDGTDATAVHVDDHEEPLAYLHDVDLEKKIPDIKLLTARVFSLVSWRYKATDDFRDRPREHLHGRHGLDMKKLRRFVAEHPELSDDTPVLAERIEDAYFLNYSWATLRIRSHESMGEPHFDSEYHRTTAIMQEKDFNGEDVVVIDAHW